MREKLFQILGIASVVACGTFLGNVRNSRLALAGNQGGPGGGAGAVVNQHSAVNGAGVSRIEVAAPSFDAGAGPIYATEYCLPLSGCVTSWDGGAAGGGGGVSNPNVGLFVSGGLLTDGGDIDTGGHLQSHGGTPALKTISTAVNGVFRPDAGNIISLASCGGVGSSCPVGSFIEGTDTAGQIQILLDGGVMQASGPLFSVTLNSVMPDAGWSVVCEQDKGNLANIVNANIDDNWNNAPFCYQLDLGCSQDSAINAGRAGNNTFDVVVFGNYTWPGSFNSSTVPVYDGGNSNAPGYCILNYHIIGWSGGIGN